MISSTAKQWAHPARGQTTFQIFKPKHISPLLKPESGATLTGPVQKLTKNKFQAYQRNGNISDVKKSTANVFLDTPTGL